MPEVAFYLDDQHYRKYKKLNPKSKRALNEKVRTLYYKLIDEQ